MLFRSRVKSVVLVEANGEALVVRADGDAVDLEWTALDAKSFKSILQALLPATSPDALRDAAEYFARMDDREGYDATIAAAKTLSEAHLEAVNSLTEEE